MIEFKNVKKTFNHEKTVLNNVSFVIPDNVIYGLIGANGVGKSSLLRLITNVLKEDEGEILIDGRSIYDNEEIKKNIVFVPDDLFFFSNYNLIDTAKFYMSLYEEFDMDFVFKEAKRLKLDIKKNISKFSKGMKRECALLCALACNTKYIILDETFDGLDPVIRKHFKELLIKQMTKRDTTIILSSHSLRELEDICDTLGLLYNGNIFLNEDIDNLKKKIVKVQVAFNKNIDDEYFKDIPTLSYKRVGNVITIIMEDSKSDRKKIEKLNPTLVEYLPLSLEEIFIYKMEELGYEF